MKQPLKATPQDLLNRHLMLLTTDIDEFSPEQCNLIAAFYDIVDFAGRHEIVPLVKYFKDRWDRYPEEASRKYLKDAQIQCKEFFAQLEAKYMAVKEFKEGKRSISKEDVSPFVSPFSIIDGEDFTQDDGQGRWVSGNSARLRHCGATLPLESRSRTEVGTLSSSRPNKSWSVLGLRYWGHLLACLRLRDAG